MEMSCKRIKMGLTKMEFFKFEADLIRSEKELLQTLFENIIIMSALHPEINNKKTAPVIEAIRKII
jgi:hypothetical protein